MIWLVKAVSILLLWGLLAGMVVGIDPQTVKDVIVINSYSPFWILLFIAITYSVVVTGGKWWGGIIIGLTVILGGILSMLGIMYLGLLIVFILTLGIESWYIYTGHEKIKSPNEQKD